MYPYFTFTANCHLRVWSNATIGTIPPSGSPSFDGGGQRLWGNELKQGYARFALPSDYVATAPNIFAGYSYTTYIGVVDDASDTITEWHRVVDASFQSASNGSGGWTIENVFVDTIPANAIIPTLAPLGGVSNLLQYPNGNNMVSAPGYLLDGSGELIADANNVRYLPAGVNDSANSLGTAGQVLTATGTAAVWATPPLPTVVYSHSWIPQTSDISSFTMLTPASSGFFQVSLYSEVITSDAGAGTVSIVLGWTDDSSSQSYAALSASLTAAGDGDEGWATIPVRAVASSNITLSATGGGTYGSASYGLVAVITQLM